MILIALGANLSSSFGAPAQTLRAALQELALHDVKIERVSPFYKTGAWPNPADPPFVNAVAAIATSLSPQALLSLLHEIEDRFGRKRSLPNAPRTLDIDLLDYEGRVEAGPPIVPHPRMKERGFVLVPLADVAPQWQHPESGEGIQSLIAGLAGEKPAPLGDMPKA